MKTNATQPSRSTQVVVDRLLAFYGVPTWRDPLPPLDELVSTILSQNTNDRNRDQAFYRLKEVFPTWEQVRDAPKEQVIEAIRIAGLANQKGPRIQAVLRRRVLAVPGAPTGEDKLIAFGEIEVDLATRSLKRNGEALPLTTGEFAVLKVLLEHPRQPLSRDRLMTLARGREQGPFDRAIDVQVSRLRKLVEPDPATPRYLQTVWGFGYVFIPDGKAK